MVEIGYADVLDKPEINVTFQGDYDFLKWIINKYKNQLPYNGEILMFGRKIHYSKNISHSWNRYGVNPRIWNFIHKDLLIAYLSGKINEFKTLYELNEEYIQDKKIKNSDITSYKKH